MNQKIPCPDPPVEKCKDCDWQVECLGKEWILCKPNPNIKAPDFWEVRE